jgi:hypothetical protein
MNLQATILLHAGNLSQEDWIVVTTVKQIHES